MNVRLSIAIVASFLALAPAITSAQNEELGKGRLGKVSFATSCDPRVQAEFERAVAMLHSFWYSAGDVGSDECPLHSRPKVT